MANDLKTYNIQELAEKWMQGTLNKEEESYFEKWYHSFDDTELRLESKIYKTADQLKEGMFRSVISAIQSEPAPNTGIIRTYRRWHLRAAVAAMLFITLSAGSYFYFLSKPASRSTYTSHKISNDIKPGGNKAVLTLADGKQIILNDATNGQLATQGEIKITKAADGQIIYTISDQQQNNNKQLVYNTIETPRGGQYQINLPDGTRVWLNASSSLKFPTQFTSNERKVFLNGEGYFEVAKKVEGNKAEGKRVPFIVKTATQTVEVLGTHFNINSYADETGTKTTLLEGSVQVSPNADSKLQTPNSKLLFPGQQSIISGSVIKVTAANTEEAIAWKNGFFMFNSRSLGSIMQQISRWYDVEVEFQGNTSERIFSGTISKYARVEEVLDMLELTGLVHFKVNGRKITVTN